MTGLIGNANHPVGVVRESGCRQYSVSQDVGRTVCESGCRQYSM